MKNVTQNLALLSAVLAFASCNNKTATTTEDKKVETTTEIAKDSVAPQAETSKEETKTVEGNVLEINNGKDGYTAKLETAEKEIYLVTISHSNLKNHEQYKTVKVGEKLKVTGDFWKTESENHITVREIN